MISRINLRANGKDERCMDTTTRLVDEPTNSDDLRHNIFINLPIYTVTRKRDENKWHPHIDSL